MHVRRLRRRRSERVSLTSNALEGVGKPADGTDRDRGSIIELLPNALVVEAHEFDTSGFKLRGEMTITIGLVL